MDVRGRYALTSSSVGTLYETIRGLEGVRGCLIISTCNRTEFIVDGGDFQDLRELLQGHYGIDADRRAAHFRERAGWDVVRHVFRLACGLESMILGESQIVGQIKQSLVHSQRVEALSPLLAKVCQSAFKAGKLVRTETGLSTGAASVAYTALIMAREFFDGLSHLSALVIGTGDMGRDVVYNLREKGLGRITVMNRTNDNAAQFAPLVGGTFKPYSEMAAEIPQNDIIITCTAAGQAIITAGQLAGDATRQQLFLDLSLPANVDRRVGDLPQIKRIDLDMIQSHIGSRMVAREQEVPKAEAIVSAELLDFQYRQIMDIASPAIVNLQADYETIRQDELLRLSGEVRDELLPLLDALSQRLVKRLAVRPLKIFREHAEANTLAMEEVLDGGRAATPD